MIGYHPEMRPTEGKVPGSPAIWFRRDDELVGRVLAIKRRVAEAHLDDEIDGERVR